VTVGYHPRRAPYPIERTLLTTGLTAAGVTSLGRGGRIQTPHLAALAYAAPAASTFMGAPSPSGNPVPLPPETGGAGVNGKTPALGRRMRIAVIGTAWGYSTHTDHITNRFLSGYPMNGEWHHPEMDVVAAYIDQGVEFVDGEAVDVGGGAQVRKRDRAGPKVGPT
jgi:hypothetical protein